LRVPRVLQSVASARGALDSGRLKEEGGREGGEEERRETKRKGHTGRQSVVVVECK